MTNLINTMKSPEYFISIGFLNNLVTHIKNYYSASIIKCPACSNPLTLQANVSTSLTDSSSIQYAWYFKLNCLTSLQKLKVHYGDDQTKENNTYEVEAKDYGLIAEIGVSSLILRESLREFTSEVVDLSVDIYNQYIQNGVEHFLDAPPFFEFANE